MKPREPRPQTVYRVLDRETHVAQGAYSRACCDEYDFVSPEEARRSNCHDTFMERAKYRVAKYRVTYELIDDDVDPPTQEEMEASRAAEERRQALEAEMDAKGVEGLDRCFYEWTRLPIDVLERAYKAIITEEKE